MPTPFPTPNTYAGQLIQTGSDIAENAFKQGIVGVLLLIAFAGVIFAVGAVIYLVRRPKQSTETSVTLALASHSDKLQVQSEKRDEAYFKFQERSINAQESVAKAIENIAEIHKSDVSDVKNLLIKIDTVGSVPLQNAITTLDFVRENVVKISEGMEGYKSLFERSTSLLEAAQQTLARIENRRATQDLNRVESENKTP